MVRGLKSPGFSSLISFHYLPWRPFFKKMQITIDRLGRKTQSRLPHPPTMARTANGQAVRATRAWAKWENTAIGMIAQIAQGRKRSPSALSRPSGRIAQRTGCAFAPMRVLSDRVAGSALAAPGGKASSTQSGAPGRGSPGGSRALARRPSASSTCQGNGVTSSQLTLDVGLWV